MSKAHGVIVHPTVMKRPVCGKGWQHRTESYAGQNGWQKATGFGIQTGKRSNITVVDIDLPARDWFDMFWAQSGLQPTMQVETPSGGCHLYYRYDPDLKNGQKNFHATDIDIDVRNDGGQIVAPTSPYDTSDAKKMKYKGKLYEFAKNDDGEDLDWRFIRPLDRIWVDMQQKGIDLDTFEIGKGVVKQKVSKPKPKPAKKKRVFGVVDEEDPVYNQYENDEAEMYSREWNNRKCFMTLMLAYGAKFNSRNQWVDGLWACCQMARVDDYDALRFANELSKQLPNYSGLQEVYTNVSSYDPMNPKNHLACVISRLGPYSDAVTTFNKNYRKKYYYVDYNKLMKQEFIAIPELERYFGSALRKYDPAGSPIWYLRYRGELPGDPDVWKIQAGNGIPFKGDNRIDFKYRKARSEADIKQDIANGKKDPPRYETKTSSFQAQLTRKQYNYPVYTSYVFRPWYGEKPKILEHELNSFRGYRHKGMTDEEWDELVVGDVKKGFDRIIGIWHDVLAGGNEIVSDYLFKWLGYIIRRGWDKIGTALVFIGSQGCGKSAMWENLVVNKIFGKDNCTIVTNMPQYCGRFNSSRLNKHLHILNECGSCRGRENAAYHDQLKSMITDKMFRCEFKGKEAIQAVDVGAYVLISNHPYCVKVEDDDRRFVVPDINPYIFKTPEAKDAFWRPVYKAIDNPLVQRAFFTFLVNQDIDNFNPRDIPETKMRQELKETKNSNKPLLYLQDLVTDPMTTDWYDHDKKEGWYQISSFKKSWTAFMGENNIRHQSDWKNVFKKYIKHWLKRTVVGKGKKMCVNGKRNAAVFLSKDVVRDICRSWLSTPDWDFPERVVRDVDLADTTIPPIFET